ncbi:MAG TPA: hypothetical protein VFK05_20655, partial [Polyangiaceae bacterium]|nr:hypothetical protein [Polyangiaceae bacterium]
GNSYVAFHAELFPDGNNPGQFLPDPVFKRRTAFYAALGQQGFAASNGIADATYSAGIQLRSNDDGFFVITDQSPGIFFNQLSSTGVYAVSHFDASFVAPSSRYSASNSDHAMLQLFGAEDGTLSPPAATSKTGEECPMLLAWAQGTERIACVADVPNTPLTTKHGVIRIFDLKPNTDTLGMSVLDDFCTDDSNAPIGSGSCSATQPRYNYGTVRATGNARAFSASGRRLAFTTSSDEASENVLYLADLNKGFALDRKLIFQVGATQPSASIDIVYSPNENILLLRRGSALTMHDLTSDAAPIPVSQDLVASPRCIEDFAKQPDGWCGNTDRVAALLWSADSKLWAFRSPGKLNVVNANQFPYFETFPLNAADCGQRCTSQFAFQPSPVH